MVSLFNKPSHSNAVIDAIPCGVWQRGANGLQVVKSFVVMETFRNYYLNQHKNNMALFCTGTGVYGRKCGNQSISRGNYLFFLHTPGRKNIFACCLTHVLKKYLKSNFI